MLHKIYNNKKMNSNNIQLSNHNRVFYGIDTVDNIKRNSDFYRNQTNFDVMYLFNKYYDSNNYPEIDEDYKEKIKIVIYTPPIDYNCGGIMVLYNLAKTINDLKIPNLKALIYTYDHKIHKNNFCNNFYNPLFMDDKTIVVYPETIRYNPLGAKYCVRWILLDLGLEVDHNHYNVWDEKDLVYHWEPSNLKYSKQLVNIWLNPKIQKINKKNRSGKTCFAFKKIINLPNTLHKPETIIEKHENSSVCIDDKSIEEIIEIFNQSELFYCYDPNTFFSIMAPLCGCITVLHPIAGVDKDTYFKSRILGHPSGFILDSGIAYDDSKEEIQRARNTLHKVKDDLIYLNKLYKNSVHSFIEDMFDLVSGDIIKSQNTVHNIYCNTNHE